MWAPTISSDEIWHHGIAGQKWGKRNGPPYPLDAEDHSVAEKKAGYQKSIKPSGVADKIKKVPQTLGKNWVESTSLQYQQQYGLSKEAADEKAKKAGETMKKVLIGAGICAAVGLTVWGIQTYRKTNMDQVISAGTTIQTLSANKDRLNVGEAFYTNFKKSDIAIYEGNFGWGKYAIQATFGNDVKVASPKTGNQVFKELIKNNSEFKENYDRLSETLFKGSKDWYGSDYNVFNAMMLPLDENSAKRPKEAKAVQKIFYDELKKKGYGGVLDVNDSFFSTLRGDSPTIIFDKTGMVQKGAKELEDSVALKQLLKTQPQLIFNQISSGKIGDILGKEAMATLMAMSVTNDVYANQAKKEAKEERTKRNK